MNDVVIQVEHLTKTYRRSRKTVEAVSDLNFEVRRGEIFGLVGPDGAGKTTTMQMLCGILQPVSGTAWVAGIDVVNQPDQLGGKIGYMSEGFSLYGSLSVEENLDFFAHLYQVSPDVSKMRKEKLLQFARLNEARSRRAEHLSGGMKKKLALACALMYSPEVLFLDEPTTGVDPVSRRDFWMLLNDFCEQGITIVVTTPYMDEAERFHRVAMMHQGKIIACDTPTALKNAVQGTLLEFDAEPQRDAAAALRLHPKITQVQLFGKRIHALMLSSDDIGDVQNELSKQNIRVSKVNVSTPTLEDVFVSMLNEKGKVAEHILRSDTRYHVKSMNKNGDNVDTEQAKEPSSAVRIAGLSKQFGNFTAVQNITLDIPQGQIFGFLGPNGSGKTTTIRMLCGLLLPSAGSGTVSGFDLRKQQRQIKAHIGYMSQKFSLYPDMTVEENLAFYAGVYGIPKDELEQRKRWVINMAGLHGHERELTRSLSGGWKQRLALGCAILHRPRVLFLDEPTSGVDPISRRAFWELIYELSAQGTTIFVTTHYMDEAEHCHALGLIYDGQLIATGSPSTLRSNMKAGEMLEITSDSPFTAIKSVQDLEGVLGVSLFGEKLHVFVEDAQKAIPNLDQALTVNGIVGQQIVPIPMTLEDLFLIYIETSRERMQAGLIEKTIQRQPIGGPL